MTERHLLKIFNAISYKDNFAEFYSPQYKQVDIDESLFNNLKDKALCFDYLLLGFKFVGGSIGATGVNIRFKSERFERIDVTIFYDIFKEKIYNQVLISPHFTKADYFGKKSIRQVSNKVSKHKDIERYIKKILDKFECPIIEWGD